jgi:hypothetical protein
MLTTLVFEWDGYNIEATARKGKLTELPCVESFVFLDKNGKVMKAPNLTLEQEEAIVAKAEDEFMYLFDELEDDNGTETLSWDELYSDGN